MLRDQLRSTQQRAGGIADFAQVHDIVGFVQPLGIRLAHGGLHAVEMFAHGSRGALLHFAGLDPAVGERDQLVPVARKLEFDLQAGDAVIEIAEQGFGLFAGGQLHGFAWLDNRRTFEANVGRRGQLEARRARRRRGSEQRAQFIEVDLFGDVVEEKRREGTATSGHTAVSLAGDGASGASENARNRRHTCITPPRAGWEEPPGVRRR